MPSQLTPQQRAERAADALAKAIRVAFDADCYDDIVAALAAYIDAPTLRATESYLHDRVDVSLGFAPYRKEAP